MKIYFLLIFFIINISFPVNASQITDLLDAALLINKAQNPDTNGLSYCPTLTSLNKHSHLKAKIEAHLKTLGSIDFSKLTAKKKIDYLVLKQFFQIKLDAYNNNDYLLVHDQQWGYVVLGNWVLGIRTLETKADYEKYIDCIQNYKAYTDANIDYLNESLRVNHMKPQLTLKLFSKLLEPYLTMKAEEAPVFEAFKKMNNSLTKQEKTKLRAKLIKAINTSYLPEVKRFTQYFRKNYIPKAPTKIAATHNGADYYEYRIRKYTTLNLDADKIHKLGLSEVKRIQSEMREIMEQVSFQGSLKDFFEFLRTSPQFYAKTENEFIKEITHIMKKIDGKISLIFNRTSSSPYSFRIMPKETAKTGPSGYMSFKEKHDPKGRGTGYFVINTYNLKSRPLYNLTALTLHEADPGHHLQYAIARELKHLHKFRASYRNSAFSEGWGLYAERLGLDMRLYENPYDNFGRLNFEIWRAIRLVVDTGIHAKSWSRQEAINYMLENSSVAQHEATTEIDRYIGWPGQALGYKIGGLTFKQLRNEASSTLGDKFNLREFNDALIGNGPLPMQVLQTTIREKFGIKKPKVSFL